jgi:hypothetical protein
MHNAIVQGGAFTSFSDCWFSNWNEKAATQPLVVVKSGRVQISNSTFATTQPSVRLGSNVRHAIIQGNNGGNGVRVENQIGDRAIIINNEPTSRPG